MQTNKIDSYLETESLTLVFLGNFNPSIFQPFWFSSKKLIREEEAVNARINVIHPEIVKFSLDWLNVEVEPQRLIIASSQSPYFEAVKDFALGILQVLPETPLTYFGINNTFDINLRDSSLYEALGSKLTPLNFWENSLSNPRLMNIEIVDDIDENGINGKYRIRIRPSDLVKPYGVSINVNKHFEIQGGSISCKKIIDENWDKMNLNAKELINDFLIKIL